MPSRILPRIAPTFLALALLTIPRVGATLPDAPPPPATGLAAGQAPETGLSAPFATERRVNTFTEDRQQDPALAVDGDGRILVAWSSRRQEFGTSGVYAQFLDPLGRPLGTEIHVNARLAGPQAEPATAFAPDGSAWVAWRSSGQDGQAGGIYLRRLEPVTRTDEAGDRYVTLSPSGPELRVNETAKGDQRDPVLSVGPDGSIFAAWVSDHDGEIRAYGRVLDPDGLPASGEFRLGERSGVRESLPSIARLSDGRAAAVWASHDPADGAHEIYGRIFARDGTPLGEPFRISGADGEDHVEPVIDATGADRFVVAWMSTPPGGSGEYRVTARRFAADTGPIGDAWRIDPAGDGYVNGALVTGAPDGHFLLAWNVHHGKTIPTDGHRPGHSVSIRGQVYDAAGRPIGGAFRLNRTDEGEQTLQVGLNARHAAWTALGQVALAWHGRIDDDSRGIGLTLYAPTDLVAQAPPVVRPEPAVDFSAERLSGERNAPPEWNPSWVDDSHLPAPAPRGTDFGFEAFQSTEWRPPDPDLAVGPNHIVGVVNIWIRFFDKSGNILLDQHLADFFGSTSFSFDPIAMYDPLVDRFVVASAEHDPSGRDYLNIAVSDDDNPVGTWYTYRFYIESYCDYVDFPNLGSDPDAWYIAADCFGSPGGNYINIFEKAPMLVGDPVTIDNLYTSGGFLSLGATKAYDATAPAAYFASAHAVGSPYVRIYAVTDPAGSPQLHSFNLNVGSFGMPPDAQQLGTSNRADTIDYRIKNGVVRDGILYVVHNVSGGDGAAKARWYRIDLRGWPQSGQDPVKLDGGDVDPGFNIDTWFGDVNVDADGNMAIAVNRSSPNEPIGVYRTFRLVTDPAGTTRPTVEMQTSTTPEQGSRWGDYAGLEEDPAEPGTFWNHHEYRTWSWRTWMGQFAIEPGIKLSNMTPLVRGDTATFETTSMAPGERAWFLYSLAGQGAGPCIPRLGDLCLDILDPVVILGSPVPGEDRVATRDRVVPPGAPQAAVWFQSVVRRGTDGARSVKSNVTADTIQ
jgi:hypothetical protein